MKCRFTVFGVFCMSSRFFVINVNRYTTAWTILSSRVSNSFQRHYQTELFQQQSFLSKPAKKCAMSTGDSGKAFVRNEFFFCLLHSLLFPNFYHQMDFPPLDSLSHSISSFCYSFLQVLFEPR